MELIWSLCDQTAHSWMYCSTQITHHWEHLKSPLNLGWVQVKATATPLASSYQKAADRILHDLAFVCTQREEATPVSSHAKGPNCSGSAPVPPLTSEAEHPNYTSQQPSVWWVQVSVCDARVSKLSNKLPRSVCTLDWNSGINYADVNNQSSHGFHGLQDFTSQEAAYLYEVQDFSLVTSSFNAKVVLHRTSSWLY